MPTTPNHDSPPSDPHPRRASNKTTPVELDDLDRFIHRLNIADGIPTWNQAATMGVELVDTSLEHRLAQARLDATRDHYAANVDTLTADDQYSIELYIETLERRLAELAPTPGRYQLASGETIQLDPDTHQAHRVDWWIDDEDLSIITPNGRRFHRAGIDPGTTIHPSAHVDETARVEAGAIIGAGCRVGAHTHIGHGAMLDARCLIQDGTWIGPGTEVRSQTWISNGATIGAHSVIGNRTTIGAGARVGQRSQIEPFSRLGPHTTTTTGKRRDYHSSHLAGAIDQLMRLDHD